MALDSSVEHYYEEVLSKVCRNLVEFGWEKSLIDVHLSYIKKASGIEKGLEDYKVRIHKIYLSIPYHLKEYFVSVPEVNSLHLNQIIELFDEAYDAIIEKKDNRKENKDLDNDVMLFTKLVHYGLSLDSVQTIFEVVHEDDNRFDKESMYEKNRIAFEYLKEIYLPYIALRKFS